MPEIIAARIRRILRKIWEYLRDIHLPGIRVICVVKPNQRNSGQAEIPAQILGLGSAERAIVDAVHRFDLSYNLLKLDMYGIHTDSPPLWGGAVDSRTTNSHRTVTLCVAVKLLL